MRAFWITISICGLLGIQPRLHAQPEGKRKATVDSLDKQAGPYTQLKDKYKQARFHRVQAPFAYESIIVAPGDTIHYQTTNNEKVRALLSRMPSISPVDFLLGLRGIEGYIVIPTTTHFDWVTKQDIPQLLQLAHVDVITPQIKQGNPPGWKPLRKRDLQQHSDSAYLKTPLGINALDLIGSYLMDIFPCSTPSYESVKTWYDSGKPKDQYKYDPFTPVMRDPVFSKTNSPDGSKPKVN